MFYECLWECSVHQMHPLSWYRNVNTTFNQRFSENTFRSFHCFLQAKRISEAEEKYEEIMKSLDPHLSSNYQRRCEEATKEGTNITNISSKTPFLYLLLTR